MSGTRFQKTITIGAAVTALASLAATVMLYVNGQIQVTREINYIQTGVSTGAVLQVGGVTQLAVTPFTCTRGAGVTSSGGLATYDFCLADPPFATTGSLLALGLECGNVPRPFSMSGAFVKSAKTSLTAASFLNFGTKTVGSGANITTDFNKPGISSGSILWNPADKLKIQALSPTWNTGNDCKGWYIARDKYGN